MPSTRFLLHELYDLGEAILACMARMPDDDNADAELVDLIQQREACLDRLPVDAPAELHPQWQQLSTALAEQDEALKAATAAVEQRFMEALQAVDHAHQAHVSYENTHGQPRAILSPDLRA